MPTIEQAMAEGVHAHRAGGLELAQKVYEAIVRQAPHDSISANAWANLAALHERQNRVVEAADCAIQSLGIEPEQSIAGLVAARCSRRNGQLQQALIQLEQIPSASLTSGMMFERARVLDRLGRYAEAYPAFVSANQQRTREHPGINRSMLPKLLETTKRCFTEDWVESWSEVSSSVRSTPLFLVGFNRSGTTLLDRMLDAHPGVEVLEEVSAIDLAREELDGRYPHGIADLSQSMIDRSRAAYFSVVDRHIQSGFTGLVVDKLPLNTMSLGLIYRLFPDARVVMSLRHPADVVLSNFMQAYTPNPITTHFDSITASAQFYADVMGLGNHLRSVLPIPVLELRYEDLVRDWESELRRLLQFAGLPWDDRLLEYRDRAATQGEICTPSYDQVVEPIFTRSIGRWRNYADEVSPIWKTLAPFIHAFGYSD
jgi:tetratricopeptide (TPR) repeat protein